MMLLEDKCVVVVSRNAPIHTHYSTDEFRGCFARIGTFLELALCDEYITCGGHNTVYCDVLRTIVCAIHPGDPQGFTLSIATESF